MATCGYESDCYGTMVGVGTTGGFSAVLAVRSVPGTRYMVRIGHDRTYLVRVVQEASNWYVW